MKNRILHRYLVLAAIFFVVLAASFAASVLISVNNLAERSELWQVLIIGTAIVSAIGLTQSLKSFISQNKFFKSLEMENSYTLGHKTIFYNLEAFKNKVESLSKQRRLSSRREFIITFSCTSLKISSNEFNNDMISSLNYQVSLYLEELFTRRVGTIKTNCAYGFNRGVFLLCLFTNNEGEIPQLIENINSNIYRIVKEKNIKVYVQPFYGIKELVGDENITTAIEDSFLARNVSETNFESFTFFNPSFKKESNREDIFEIEEALRNNEFIIYYQPKFSLKERKVISSEALARWDSPKHGLLTPGMFIGKAESAGLISLIDNYIFELALKNLSEQIKRGRRVVPVSVNFSIY